jgi:hypothetical protein
MSPRRKAFIIWLTIMVLFVAVVSTIDAFNGPVELSRGGVDQLIAAAEAHAKALQEGGNPEEAARWERLAAAARVEARRFIP